jgi:hypothetical protein
MGIIGKVIAITNLIIAVLLLFFVYSLSSTMAVVYSPVLILIIIIPIILGLVNSLLFFKRSNWNLSETTKADKVFFAVPIINTFVFLLLGSMMG